MGPQRHSSPNTFLLGTRLPRTTVGSLPTQFKGRALATVHSRPASRNQHATHVGQSGPPELWLRDERCPHRGTRQGARLRLTSSPQGPHVHCRKRRMDSECPLSCETATMLVTHLWLARWLSHFSLFVTRHSKYRPNPETC